MSLDNFNNDNLQFKLKLYKIEDKKIPYDCIENNISFPCTYNSSTKTIYHEGDDIHKKMEVGGILHTILHISAFTLDVPLIFSKEYVLSYGSYWKYNIYLLTSETITVDCNITGIDFCSPNNKSLSTNITLCGQINVRSGDVPYLQLKIQAINTDGTEYDGEIQVSNVYFEPKTIPNSLIVYED